MDDRLFSIITIALSVLVSLAFFITVKLLKERAGLSKEEYKTKYNWKGIFTACVVLMAIILSLALYIFNPARLFKLHVLSNPSQQVKQIGHYKDGCAIHGPLVFVFLASDKDIQNIIEENDFIEYQKLPGYPKALLHHIDTHNFAWWKNLEDLEQLRMYGRQNSSSSELACEIIFIDKKNRVYYLKG